MEQVRVLIVTDSAEFVQSMVQSWYRSSCTPEFSVASLHGSAECSGSQVVLADGPEALAHLGGEVLMAIVITGDEPLPAAGNRVRRMVQIRRSAGWADIAAALTKEIVLCAQAQRRVVEVENQLRESERFAALGRFIAEARHGLANALTSVLGNSELVLLETESGLTAEVRGQLKTIHSMSLKIHETLQGLSSLDREMQMMERRAEQEALREPA